ncbi:MAG TPA: LacI family DNA-binding transcriptional regulator [Acidobacteriaceae bacterium]|jgi:LacI family transcriptional regulator|nr:LacI family DNA-binding transcriptional regulator [Acidobacteriaceae bacterium]
MRIRLKDIAEDLNLSKMTISKVLRGQTDISDATRARVLQRVKELNYIPNVSASSLRTGQTRTMGLILPSLGIPYLAEIAAGISRTLSPEKYGLIVSSSENDLDAEQKQIDVFLSLQVDALLLVSLQEAALFFEALQRRTEMPVIFVASRPSGITERYVGIDEEEVGRTACEHLIQSGCRRIAYIRGFHSAAGDMRSQGYRHALRRNGIEVQPELVVETMNMQQSEYQRGSGAMEKLLSRRKRPDGVMTYSDMLAVGAMDAASRAGMRIPEDIRFSGCGNDPLLCTMGTPLTSIDTGGQDVGERAGKLALRLVGHPKGRGAQTILLKPKVVKRRSSEGVR